MSKIVRMVLMKVSVPVEKPVATLKSTGVTGSTTGVTTLIGFVKVRSERLEQV